MSVDSLLSETAVPSSQALAVMQSLGTIEHIASEARRNLGELEEQNAALNIQCARGQEQVEALESEAGQLRGELEKARTEHDHLAGEKRALEARLHERHEENTRLHDQVIELGRALHSSNSAVAALHERVYELHRDISSEDLPTLIIKLAMELTGAQVGLFTEADGDGTLAKLGFTDLAPFIIEALYDYSRTAAHAEAPIVENDSNKLPDGSQLVNLAALPVATQGQPRGVLLLADKRTGPFTEADTRLLLAIGQHAGIALENYRLNRSLTEAYAGTVAVLADAIEAKDAYTRGHCEDVARVAVEVAQLMGVRGEQLQDVRYAALLHDVGKIGVPDGVLLKPGKLLPEEFSIIQRHAQIGRDLVARVPALAALSEAILHHHERWDGSGYPHGLSGEGIPLISRIIGAVDAYDAMTTPRPYRLPVASAEALNEMQRCSGSQFDPQVVENVKAVISSVAVDAVPAKD